MGAVESVEFELAANNRVRGRLRISILGSRTESVFGGPLLVDDRRAVDREDAIEPVQLVEGTEYRYSVTDTRTATFDVAELFSPDDRNSQTAGRLRTGLNTGRVELRITVDGIRCEPIAFEVRSSKLEYLDHYRWMLGDLARLGSELVLERFAASEQRLTPDSAADAATLYQRFALLTALLESDRLDAAFRQVLASPYVQWKTAVHDVSPGRTMRPSATLVRALAAPGPRVHVADPVSPVLSTLPRRLSTVRTEETVDNIPNRFVRFALEEWSSFIQEIRAAVVEEQRAHGGGAAWVARACAETERLAARLEGFLRHPVFADVGPLLDFPGPNQVLQRREGYREILEAHAMYRYAATLSWEGGEDVFHGGQRNVAALYEYWVFLKIAEVLGEVSEVKPDLRSLIALDASGMSLGLRRGKAHELKARFIRGTRSFGVELWFNRTFAPGSRGESWTLPIRPDCSLRIVPEDTVAPPMEELWLHFDAKYKFEPPTWDSSGADPDLAWAKADDLKKMHTYRDAITRAAGAYVIFPGSAEQLMTQHGETLPSLGAFPLRPTTGDRPEGAERLRSFLAAAFDQLADQCSRYERARFWQRRAIGDGASPARLGQSPLLTRPPADTLVLLGFVKSPEHLAWVERNRLYNLRADAARRGSVGLSSQELSAEFLVTYGDGVAPALWRVGAEPILMDRLGLIERDYPNPGGDRYLCLSIEAVARPEWLAGFDASRLGTEPRGAPRVVRWSDLATVNRPVARRG